MFDNGIGHGGALRLKKVQKSAMEAETDARNQYMHDVCCGVFVGWRRSCTAHANV